jgi:hypothetical protein
MAQTSAKGPEEQAAASLLCLHYDESNDGPVPILTPPDRLNSHTELDEHGFVLYGSFGLLDRPVSSEGNC